MNGHTFAVYRSKVLVQSSWDHARDTIVNRLGPWRIAGSDVSHEEYKLRTVRIRDAMGAVRLREVPWDRLQAAAERLKALAKEVGV